MDKLLPSEHKIEPHSRFYKPHSGNAFMPLEFSVSAFRFGHSMARPSYTQNNVATSTARFKSKDDKMPPFARFPVFVPMSNDPHDALNGFGEPLHEAWGINWSFFFGTIPPAKQGVKQIPQPSYRIVAQTPCAILES